MISVQCKNLRRIFLRHIKKGERLGEVYAYSISFRSLEEARKEQVQEIARIKDKPDNPFFRSSREDKIKRLEESLQTIDKFMEWENKKYAGVVRKS